jgi:DNA-binding IclR family transcriptional regulator
MAANSSGISRAESERRIPVNVDLSEIDALIDALPDMGRIIPDGGFTLDDLAKQRRTSNTTAFRMLSILIDQGKVRHIGYRPGPGKQKVFEIVNHTLNKPG